jgi:energy-converting hydrogenase Eha subunit B
MKIKPEYKSALRHFAITAAAVFVANPDADAKAFIAGVVAAIVGPAIRAIDKHDECFGHVAIKVEDKIKKSAKRAK